MMSAMGMFAILHACKHRQQPRSAVQQRKKISGVSWLLIVCSLLLFAMPVQADVRASVDRDRVTLGETVVLNIEIDSISGMPPDFRTMSRDFQVKDMTTNQQVDMVNGRVQLRVQFLLILEPSREGVLTIPALNIGGQQTQPLTVTVQPARNAPSTAAPEPEVIPRASIFLDSRIETETPYAQQSVGYVVRLYYLPGTLIEGQLNQPLPQGATLPRIGEDREYTRDIGGRQYKVLERRFLVIPERSGQIQIPPAEFEGRSVETIFDQVMGGRGDIQIKGKPYTLQARAIPGSAPQPWLPLRGLHLRYLEASRGGHAGEASTVVLEAVAEGAGASQLPELQLRANGDAQVFAEAAQIREDFVNDRPQVTVTRKFSIVPNSTGALRISGPRIVWWDVQAGIARTESLPDLVWQVQPGTQAAGSNAAATNPAGGTAVVAKRSGLSGMLSRAMEASPWLMAAVFLVLLWLFTLVWGWRLWTRRSAVANTVSSSKVDASVAASGPRFDLTAFTRVLNGGDLGDITDALCALAQPTTANLDELRARLDDPAQRAAIDALQHARWGDGRAVEARAALRAAFAAGPRWRIERPAPKPILAPLYPE